LAERDNQRLEQLSETGLRACPRGPNLSCLAALFAADSRQVGVDIGFVLKEVEVTPLAVLRVMNGLTLGATGWARKAATTPKTNFEIDPAPFSIKGNILDFPWGWLIRERR